MTKRNRMNTFKCHFGVMERQRGATLIIGLIMLVLITLMMVGAFTMSSTNLKSVGNMQVRQEAVAAANTVVEQIISSPFTNNPAVVANDYPIDINKDGITDYSVTIATPACTRATTASSGTPSDVELGPTMSSSSTWNTEWDIDALVTDGSSGATAHIHQGVRVLLTNAQKMAVCP